MITTTRFLSAPLASPAWSAPRRRLGGGRVPPAAVWPRGLPFPSRWRRLGLFLVPLVAPFLTCSGTMPVRADSPAANPVSTVYSFTGDNDGAEPQTGLTVGADGSLYGTATVGGSGSKGTIFRLTTAGQLTSLFSFPSTGADGAYPLSTLLLGSDGNFYGNTVEGGTANRGVLFRLTSGGTLTVLHHFGAPATDGALPTLNPLMQGSDGNLYGATFYGGTPTNRGTVYRMTMVGTTYSQVVIFPSTGSQGALPIGRLLQLSDGNFYGAAQAGGIASAGLLFRLTPGGMLTAVHQFTNGDGADPQGIIQGTDGNLYGAAATGGSTNHGVVYRVSAAGANFSLLHQFTGFNAADPTSSDGDGPADELVPLPDGSLAGVTTYGGADGVGTVYRVSPDGSQYTLVHSFNTIDGAYPQARLVLAADGNLYGTTRSGGTANAGTVFRVTLAPATPPATTGSVHFVKAVLGHADQADGSTTYFLRVKLALNDAATMLPTPDQPLTVSVLSCPTSKFDPTQAKQWLQVMLPATAGTNPVVGLRPLGPKKWKALGSQFLFLQIGTQLQTATGFGPPLQR